MITKIKNKIFKIIAPLMFYLFRVIKIKKNKIVIMNYYNKGYGDNSKYIVEELLKSKEKYDIVWTTENIQSLPQEIRSVKPKTIKWIYEMATAKIWINNTRFELYVRKRKGQFYIQTWHSALRTKKIEMDAVEDLGDYYKRMMKKDSKYIDLMISGCDFSYDIYKRAFLYNGSIEKIGTPRCDVFFDKEKSNHIKNEIQEKYGIEKNKKIILYAPTFRNDESDTSVFMKYQYVKEKLGEEYIVLVRMHPNSKIKINNENNNIINVTDYPDMQELLCASDILITDYSGCCFDMLIADKICVLFIKDLEEYTKKNRKTYFTMEELPFPKVKDEDELIKKIKEDKFEDYYIEKEKFKKRIGLYENGTAAKKIKKIIDDVMEGRYNEKI